MKTKNSIRHSMFESNLVKELHKALLTLDIVDISITDVRINSDFRYADVYCAPILDTSEDDAKTAISNLNKQKHKISRILVERISGKVMPKCRFKLDQSIASNAELEAILDSI